MCVCVTLILVCYGAGFDGRGGVKESQVGQTIFQIDRIIVGVKREGETGEEGGKSLYY